MDALFKAAGDRFYPSEHAASPWGSTLHGGAVGALFGRQFEQMAAGRDPMQLARLSVEIFKAVPLSELTIESRVSREGRRVRFAEAELRSGGDILTRATATWIRDESMPLTSTARNATLADPPFGPAPDGLARWPGMPELGGFMAMLDIRPVVGGLDIPGPATMWMRPTLPIVADEVTTPLMAAIAVADCGSGVGSLATPSELTYINPDLTVFFARDPQSDWIGISSVTHPTERGHGYQESRLSDLEGAIGHGVQTLFLENRVTGK